MNSKKKNESIVSFHRDMWNAMATAYIDEDIRLVSGYQPWFYRDPENICKMILSWFDNLIPESKILDVGCAAGNISRYVKNFAEVVGVDITEDAIARYHKEIGPNAYVSEGNNLPFEDKSFDYSFCFNVFQYFPSIMYARQVIEEMKRVSVHGIFLGSLKSTDHEDFKKIQRSGNTHQSSKLMKQNFRFINFKSVRPHQYYPIDFIKKIGGIRTLDEDNIPPSMHSFNIYLDLG